MSQETVEEQSNREQKLRELMASIPASESKHR